LLIGYPGSISTIAIWLPKRFGTVSKKVMMPVWRILDRLPDIGVASLTTDGKILRCNDAFGVILCDDKLHLTGQNIIKLTVPEDRARVRTSLISLNAEEVGHVKLDKRYVLKEGGSVCCRVTKLLIKSKGKPNVVLVFIYEMETSDSGTDRIRKLESLLEKTLAIVQRSNKAGTTIQMVNRDNSQKVSADRGGHAILQNQNSKSVMIAVIIMLGIVVIGTLALVFGGGVSFRHGEIEVEIDSNEVVE
jgi:PAS domain S-box-containing protein